MTQLSAKEQVFVEQMLLTGNAAESARRAGYAASTADKKAPMWVGKSRDKCPKNKLHVWDAFNQMKQERTERTKIDADWLLKRLVMEVEADMADLYNDDGSIKDVKDWPVIWRQGLVTGMNRVTLLGGSEVVYDENGDEVEEDRGVEKSMVRLSDRVKRLEMIGRHVEVQAFKDQTEHSFDLSIAERLASRRQARNERSRRSDNGTDISGGGNDP